MITSVEIENFRCFKRLRVEGLARVNLIVGANNSGKTVLLEAIEEVVSSERKIFSLYRSSRERGEHRVRRTGTARDIPELDLRHWFHGHRLDPGAMFNLRTTGERELSVLHRIEAVPPDASSRLFVPDGLRLVTERSGVPSRPLPLLEDGWLQMPFAISSGSGLRLHPPVGFVTTGRPSPRTLARLWTRIVLTPGEAHTVEALRLVEPAIERIAISEGDRPIAQVLLRGAEEPVPLGTLGEGVSRILMLALHLVLTQGGYLLLDEIENGLHWSVMPKVWRFLIETALARNVQVFATTHSKDWLEGLADLHRADPELAANVSVHRLEAGRETSVRFDAGRIAEYVEMELEAR